MDIERIIDDIQQLEEMFEAPDIRPLTAIAIAAANRREALRVVSVVAAFRGSLPR